MSKKVNFGMHHHDLKYYETHLPEDIKQHIMKLFKQTKYKRLAEIERSETIKDLNTLMTAYMSEIPVRDEHGRLQTQYDHLYKIVNEYKTPQKLANIMDVVKRDLIFPVLDSTALACRGYRHNGKEFLTVEKHRDGSKLTITIQHNVHSEFFPKYLNHLKTAHKSSGFMVYTTGRVLKFVSISIPSSKVRKIFMDNKHELLLDIARLILFVLCSREHDGTNKGNIDLQIAIGRNANRSVANITEHNALTTLLHKIVTTAAAPFVGGAHSKKK